MIPGSANPLLLKSAAAAGGYQIERSLRFNSSDSGFCSRSVPTAGSLTTWTWAGWAKRSSFDTTNNLFAVYPGSNFANIRFVNQNIDFAEYTGGSYSGRKITTAVFRDPSAWYHIVATWDTTNGTAADRMRLYVNGVRVDAFSTSTDPGPSATSVINTAVTHRIGTFEGSTEFFNGYLADIHFIDGQALTPSSFTEVSATTGQLIPKAYSGSFGTNGFWLKFSDNSAATAATLGKDYSGNSNNWTPNNLSVTAGAGNDSLVDTPTSFGTDTSVGGEVRGNYATWNPLNTKGTLTNGNLDGATGTTDPRSLATTIAVSSGKWYTELTCSSISADCSLGVSFATFPESSSSRNYSFADGVAYYANGTKYVNGSNSSYGASYATNDVIGVAIDFDNNQITFYKNGSSQGAISKTLLGSYVISVTGGNSAVSETVILNAGQRAFAYQTPGTNRPAATFLALCDTNIPEGTITTSGTYTGNGVADGPFVYLNGVPTAMTVGGNAVTFGTHADKLSNGFKLRTTSTTYNQNALSYSYSITTTGAKFKYARAQPNP